jgi:hypothetical protein
MGAALDAVAAADSLKPTDYSEGDQDFWKPLTPGDSLNGVYLGTDTSGRIKQHLIAVKSEKEKGRVIVKRFNGSMKLTKDIQNNGIPYRALQVTWNGKTTTGNARQLNQYVLKWGPRPTAR